MANLHAPAPTGTDPEEISTFLSHFLHNSSSSSSSSSCMPFESKYVLSFSSGSNAESKSGAASVVDQFGRDVRVRAENRVSPAGEISCYGEKDPEAPDAPPSNAVRPKTSSKRSRAAEVHNLSEKRRRCRINERLKALQSLIPNSNKTDKASMLDKAIEYLQQLQLQVQMLAMRNRTSLYPSYSPGALHLSQLPPTGVWHHQGQAAFSANEATTMGPVYNLSNQCVGPNGLISVPPEMNMSTTLESPFGFNQSSVEADYGSLNLARDSEVTNSQVSNKPRMT